MKKRVYIAGKVTGEPKHSCALKFATAANELRSRGYEAVNPIEIVGDFNAQWETAMRKCIAALMACDYIYLLPDWEESEGAWLELELAETVGIKVLNQS